MAKPDILIVEDDDILRDIYVKKFAMAGFEIRSAKDGAEAVEEVENKPPDVMILDIQMPVMGGFAVLSKYPKEERDFPIIVLTNFGDEKTKNYGNELGADDFFIKQEMTIKTLLEMVENLLKARKYWKDEE